jgi:predicted HTH transcriptional regulator
MIEIKSIEDVELLRESVDLECKLATGRDGQGALSQDFWPTYSAFANTEGGLVLLGLRQHKGRFEVVGIANPGKVRQELFDGLNNRQKVSANLLTNASVKEFTLEGKTLLAIEIPRATRKQRPVHLTRNPFDGNTRKRLHEADVACSDDEVKRMLAEQVEDSRDDRVLKGYELEDLDKATFRTYRRVFSNRDPNHPWNELADREFLRQIGGWRKDRETGESGLTLAGLLMFGQMASIQEELPNYMLDYQERPEAKAELRWVDRLTLDGKWSGNLYDFYRRVYMKLTADLKVPFALEKGERKDETPVHEALREALANVLVHADYSDRASVLVVKRPDMFGFRNPGLMRIPPEIAIQGGEHDCRNRTLHKLFRLVGVGEQAGTGIPKIFRGWRSQHWRAPALYEKREPYNQTLLELRMIDLLPPEILAQLRTQFTGRFDQFDPNERLALATAATERVVTHGRLLEMTTLHPVDVTRILQHLVREGFLLVNNPGRGAVYFLPGTTPPKPEDVFAGSSEHLGFSSEHLPASSALLQPQTAPSAEERNADGCLLSAHLDAPIVDSILKLNPTLRVSLEQMAAEPRTKGKLDRDKMQAAILQLCHGRYVTLSALAELVNRAPDALRQQYLKPMTKAGLLKLAFPASPTHAKQAYRSVQRHHAA